MGRRLPLLILGILALAGCVRVKGLPYRPIHRPEPVVAPSTAAAANTRALEADCVAWRAVHPMLADRLALGSRRDLEPQLPAGRVHLIGAVAAKQVDVPDGGRPLGELVFGATQPTFDADLTRIVVVDPTRAWLVDWWNLSEGCLRSCPFRVGGGSLVVVFPSRGHEAELRVRFWQVIAGEMASSADAEAMARAGGDALCKPIDAR